MFSINPELRISSVENPILNEERKNIIGKMNQKEIKAIRFKA